MRVICWFFSRLLKFGGGVGLLDSRAGVEEKFGTFDSLFGLI